jgi:ABC-type nitrate/sulfonate/bicarbonate transport system ATPase subunit
MEPKSNEESHPVNLVELKALIHKGIEAIPLDRENNEAVIMIGDTGVGKSTIMSFLAGSELVVRWDGLKPILATV